MGHCESLLFKMMDINSDQYVLGLPLIKVNRSRVILILEIFGCACAVSKLYISNSLKQGISYLCHTTYMHEAFT